jgi:hypothetical protein
MQEALQEDFLYILGLPGLIRRVCYEANYMDIFLKFVIDFGTENAVRVFSSDCFAKRVGNETFMDHLMYCMRVECPGILFRFEILAPYFDRLSNNFYQSFIDPSSGWSKTLCENLVREIKKIRFNNGS